MDVKCSAVQGDNSLSSTDRSALLYRQAIPADLEALVQLENTCFANDRLSRRSFKRWLAAPHGIFWVAQVQSPESSEQGSLAGYGLVWCHRGTRLARLYSLAVCENYRGRGIARHLIAQLEELVVNAGYLVLRLEVAEHNANAIALYQSLGYRVFGEYCEYYQDKTNALRLQKNIAQSKRKNSLVNATEKPWYQQTTDFTCGPAALMMAMANLDNDFVPSQNEELAIWRQATTIFMTSGHGGCHPVGLALAANQRGFEAQIMLNTTDVLFVDGVRSDDKKQIMSVVHEQFLQEAHRHNILVRYEDVQLAHIEEWLERGYAVLVLISTYRLDGRKAPHWVTITHADQRCFYVHDPDVEEGEQLAIDCQYVPIAREDFNTMSAFGSGRLRTAVAIFRSEK